MSRRGDSGEDGQRRPLRKWGSRSGGGPVRPPQARPDERTQRLEQTRRLGPRPPVPPRGRADHREDYRDGYYEEYPDDGYPDYRESRRRHPDDAYPERYREDDHPPERRPARRPPDERYPERYRERGERYPERYDDERYPDERYREDRYPERYPERYREPAPERYPERRPPRPRAAAPAPPPPVPVPDPSVPKKLTVTRVAAARTSYLSRKLVRKVGAASRAQGASETGLTQLIWLNAVNMAADAMIAICLAGTIFFSAATSQQRGNVALYLLITVAPFAVVAPVIGPLLDRMQHGRRWALAGTLLGRALLAYVMASNFHGIALYPAAFGALVLGKAYGVLRAAAVPRVMPEEMTLVSANARLSIFGLVAALIAGVLLGVFIKLSGSYPAALWVTAAVFVVGALLAVRLPRHVDSAERSGQHKEPAPIGQRGRLALGGHVLLALRSTAAIRGLNGFLTLFMAFLIQTRMHGATAAFELGAVVAGAGVGSLVGTTMGARLRLARPDAVVLTAIGLSAGTCVVAAVAYSIRTAVLLAFVVGAANSLAKLALDAIIQREVPEHLTASAFARSETVLQLAWVFGGGLGIVLPSRGTVGFSVAAALMAAAFAFTLATRRGQQAPQRPRPGRLDADGYPAG